MKQLSERHLLNKIRSIESGIYRLGTFSDSLVMDLIANTKLTRLGVRRLYERTFIMDQPYVQKRASQPFKTYQGVKQVPLNDYKDITIDKPFSDISRNRKSTKVYEKRNITLMHLGVLLYRSYGFNRQELLHEARVPWNFRPIPSPGGLFASEIYVVVLNADIDAGLYHYRPDINTLELVKSGDFTDFARQSCGIEAYIDSPDKIGGLVIFTSLIERLFIKYGERAYKFMMIETGLLAQQLSLVAEALGMGTCMVGGYFDDEVHDFLEVDGLLESVQNVMVFGYAETDMENGV